MAITTVSSHVVSVNAIQGTLIADNAITAVHIATNAVSGTLIADNAITAVHVAQNSITVTQLADDCVESDKIADGVITTNHLNKAMISSQTEVTPVAGDFVLLGDTSDSNNLKKAPLTLLLNSNVDLSTKLNLSGGTMTGNIAHASDFTLDIGGIMNIDADNGGNINLKDGGTHYGTLQNENGDLRINSIISDKDIIFRGSDNGTGVNALTLDMSEAGKAIFNAGANFGTTSSSTYAVQIQANTGGNALQLKGRNAAENAGWLVWTDFSGNAEAGIYATANQLIFANTTSYTETMRIDSNGHVGIGRTPESDYYSGIKAIALGNGPAIYASTSGNPNLTFNDNLFINSAGNNEYQTSNPGTRLEQFNGTLTFSNAPSGTAGQTATLTERFRINLSGCIGLGSTADRSLGTNITTTVTSGSAGSGFWMSTGNSSATSTKLTSYQNGSVGEFKINQGSGVNGGTIVFSINDSNKMNILSNGVVLIGTNTQSGISNTTSNHGFSFGGSGQMVSGTSNDTNMILNRTLGSGNMITFRNNGSTIGSISQNGSVMTYGGTSDYRLKENVADMTNATTRLKQLKPKKFNYISDTTNTLYDGFLAHEVSSVVPEAVVGEKDAEDMQMMDNSKLVPLLVKTIQELEARIATLEG